MIAATAARDSAANYQPLIRDLPPDERPRERLANHGVAALSTAELLAITLRIGRPGENALAMATRLLASFEGLEGLARASFGELASQPSVGGAKSAQIKAGLELGKRLLTTAPAERPIIADPRDVNNLLASDMGFLEQEHLRVLLLTTKNQVVDIVDISRGTVNTTQVRPAEVFREAVRRTSPAIIVAHNHPSGDPTPSPEDIAMTRRLVEAGKVLDIEVVDHVIICQGRFISLNARGLGF
jgi:DNA repair protein RadC